ncbi:MAG: cobalamin-dependent protein, partial [bacterium]
MNITFLAVNCSYSHSSLASWRLHAAMRGDEVWRWNTVEVTVKDAPQSALEQVLACRPQVVAATLYLFNHDFVIGLLSQIRSKAADCLIVVGGPQCLGDNRAILRPEGPADAALRGEGEQAFPELL